MDSMDIKSAVVIILAVQNILYVWMIAKFRKDLKALLNNYERMKEEAEQEWVALKKLVIEPK